MTRPSKLSPRLLPRLACLAAAAILLTGCGDPYARPGTWHAGNSNAANLALAVVDKHDLVLGQPDAGAEGQLAQQAVDRLLHDKVKLLPAAATTSAISSGGAGGGGGGP